MGERYDLIIVGGGCAGLSLAVRLARLGVAAPRTLILEPRAQYANDRTWSGWRLRAHPFLGCVAASWPRWRVSSDGREVIRSSAGLRYETIPAGQFYAQALREIAANARLQFHPSVAVTAMAADGGAVRIESSCGPLAACIVVDTRPPPLPPVGTRGLLQVFTGLEVETTSPQFDPELVDLMAFQPAPPGAIRFLYTLPFSPTRALVELTDFAEFDAQPPDRAELEASLRLRLGAGLRVLRTEIGRLPMTPDQPAVHPSPRILRLGTGAGALRPATGYGFFAIQGQADGLAAVLARGAEAALGWRAPPRPSWVQFMDRLFLQVLRERPEAGPDLFLSLFEGCPVPALVRFMSDAASLKDAFLVARTLPTLQFIAALLRQGRGERELSRRCRPAG